MRKVSHMTDTQCLFGCVNANRYDVNCTNNFIANTEMTFNA